MAGPKQFIQNWAEFREDARDARLRPFVLPMPPDLAHAIAVEMARRTPRWKVACSDRAGGALHLTHATRIWRFIDDVHLRFELHSGGTRITGSSRSRVGLVDFGQNARNLRELRAALLGTIATARAD